MVRLLVLVCLTLLGVFVGHYLFGTESQVIVIANGWSLETDINVAICFVIVFYALLHFLEWALVNTVLMWSRTRHWFGWRKERIAQQKTLDGVMEFISGHYANAEQLSVKNAKYSKQPLINYLTAINAASTQGKYEERDEYLKQALLVDDSNITLLSAKLRFMIEEEALEEAKTWLDTQPLVIKQHADILPLSLIVSQQLKDFDNIIKTSELLLKKKLHTLVEHDLIIRNCYTDMMNDCLNQDFESLKNTYKGFPKKYRNNIDLFCQYAKLSIKFEKNSLIEKELFQRLSKNCNNEILNVINECDSKYSADWLARLIMLKQHHSEASFIDSIVNLSLLDRQWALAKEWLLKSIVIAPSAKRYEALAEVQQQLGESSGALDSFNNALSLRTSKVKDLT